MPDVRNGATGSTGSTCSPCGTVNTFKEAACIDVNRIYDTCREQDCLEDLRVYFCEADNCLVERAVDIRCKSAEIVWVYLDTEPMSFNKGCYMVKIKFFFKCTFELCIGLKSATEITGMTTYEKKCVLYGSEGSTKTYSSDNVPGEGGATVTGGNSLIANIEVVDPVMLGCKLADKCYVKGCECEFDPCTIPGYVSGCFNDCLCESAQCEKRVLVTLGVFSIVRLERRTQLVVPSYDFTFPEQPAAQSILNADPCSLFKTINFPTDQFFPNASCPNGCNTNQRNR